MACQFKAVRCVEFADTDMAGIMHFANFFRFVESTEHAFFRSLGLSINMEHEGRRIGWPRVHVECDYLSPLRFQDEVEITLTVREVNRKSIKYDYVMHKRGDSTAEAARGSFTVVCVAWDEASGRMKAVTIPDAIASRIEAAPPDVPDS